MSEWSDLRSDTSERRTVSPLNVRDSQYTSGMRVGSYARKSTKVAGQEGKSVAEQLAINRQIIDREGWDLVAELKDDGKSASRYARKGTVREDFDKLIDMVTRGELDIVVLWEQSRATRDLRIHAELIEICAEHGVLLNIRGRTYDPSRADDRLVLGMGAVVDSAEADRTRERILRSVRANAEKGRPHGRLLYGHRRIYDKTSGAYLRTEPDPERAPIVREVIDRIVAGESMRQIGLDLDRRGIAPPHTAADWLSTQLRRFATNPSYIGKRVHKGVVVGDAGWDAIVDPDKWRAANALVTAPGRKNPAAATRRWLLSGPIMECGRCEQRRFYVHKNRGQFLAYTCLACYRMSIAAPSAEEYVRGLIVERLSRVDAVELWRNAGEADAAARTAWNEADALRDRLDGFVTQAADGGPDALSPAALAKIEARLLPQIHAAEERAKALSAPAALRELNPETAADDWLGWAMGADLRRAQKVLAAIIDLRVEPSPGNTRFARPRERIKYRWRDGLPPTPA